MTLLNHYRIFLRTLNAAIQALEIRVRLWMCVFPVWFLHVSLHFLHPVLSFPFPFLVFHYLMAYSSCS